MTKRVLFAVADRCMRQAAFLCVTLPAYVAGAVLRTIKKRPLEKNELDASQWKSILVVRVDGLGDVVILSSFLRSLRRGCPDAWITVVVDEKVRSLIELCPWVNQILGFDERGTKYKRMLVGGGRAWSFARRKLHSRHFDLAISPRWDVDSRAALFLSYFSLARYHIGFSESVNRRKARINNGTNLLLSHAITGTPKTVHEQQRNNEILSRLGLSSDTTAPELWLSNEDRQRVADILHAHKAKTAKYLVCFGIGGVEQKRLWPIERFAGVAEWLLHQLDARIVIIGDARDRLRADLLTQKLGDGIINLAGICSLRESAAVLEQCDLFVGNDSGPMHLAAAAGVPVVEISCHPVTGDAGHVNSPFRYTPLGVVSRIIQPRTTRYPCVGGCHASSAHCILDIEPSYIKRAINEVLADCFREREGMDERRCSALSAGDVDCPSATCQDLTRLPTT